MDGRGCRIGASQVTSTKVLCRNKSKQYYNAAPMKNVLTVAEARILLLTGSSPQVKSFVLSLWFPVPLGLRQSLLSAPWSIPFTPAKILRSFRTSMDIPLVLSWKELSPYYITSPSYPPCLSGYTHAREDTRIMILNTLRHEGRLI